MLETRTTSAPHCAARVRGQGAFGPSRRATNGVRLKWRCPSEHLTGTYGSVGPSWARSKPPKSYGAGEPEQARGTSSKQVVRAYDERTRSTCDPLRVGRPPPARLPDAKTDE